MRTASKVRERLGRRWFMVGALLSALMAAMTIAVELSGHLVGISSNVAVASASPAPVKLVNSGTGKCLLIDGETVRQDTCIHSTHRQVYLYPISTMSGFFQIEGVARGTCIEATAAGPLTAKPCAVRARGETTADFEARLIKQAFQKIAVAGSADTYTIKRKGATGSCWTAPGTIAAPARNGTRLTNATCAAAWDSQRWIEHDATHLAPEPVKLVNSGTGKCLFVGVETVDQGTCTRSSNHLVRFYPISTMSGFYQIEGVGRGTCIETSAGALVAKPCAVRGQNESTANFEARLTKQAFQKIAVTGSADTYTIKRKGATGSCWTAPGTITAPARNGTRLTNATCAAAWDNQRWIEHDATFLAPEPVKLVNSGTGKCLLIDGETVRQDTCIHSTHRQVYLYPISTMSGFYQIEGVARGTCIEATAAGPLTAKPCAVRGQNESTANFEARLTKQAFQKIAVTGSADTYTIKRKGATGSCWTAPGTITAPARNGTQLTNATCAAAWNNQRWIEHDATFLAPEPVKLVNSGTGKCLFVGVETVGQGTCTRSSNHLVRFYPISTMSGFYQIEGVGRGTCIETSAGALVAKPCAVRGQNESTANFEARLTKQAFQKIAVAGSADTYTIKRKGATGSCWTAPGTIAAPARNGTQLTNATCAAAWNNQQWTETDATHLAPEPVKLVNSGTGKCLFVGVETVGQGTCTRSSNHLVRFYPISTMPGFYQIEGVGRGTCIKATNAGALVVKPCAVRARGETTADFEARLTKQAFQKIAVTGSADTYTIKRKGATGSCWTAPGTIAAPARNGTRLTNATCAAAWNNQQWTETDTTFTAPTAPPG